MIEDVLLKVLLFFALWFFAAFVELACESFYFWLTKDD